MAQDFNATFAATPRTRALSYDDMTSAQIRLLRSEDMVTERLHHFHTGSGTERHRCSFSRAESSSSTGIVDDLCPSSLEQRVSACTEVFEVWNTEAWRRRVSRSSSSSRGAHNPRLRSLSTSVSKSYASSIEGSTSGRFSEHAGEGSSTISRSSSSRSTHLVIRIAPSNSSGSSGNLSDLPNLYTSPTEDCALSLPSSGCATDDSVHHGMQTTDELGVSSQTPEGIAGIISLTRTGSSMPNQEKQSSNISASEDEHTCSAGNMDGSARQDADDQAEGPFIGRVHQQQTGVFQTWKRLGHTLKLACRRKRRDGD